MFMRSCRWNLLGSMWLYLIDTCIIGVKGCVYFGMVFHKLEILVWFCVGVGMIG